MLAPGCDQDEAFLQPMQTSSTLSVEAAVRKGGTYVRKQIQLVPLRKTLGLNIINMRLNKASAALSAARNVPTKIFLRMKGVDSATAFAFFFFVLSDVIPAPELIPSAFQLVCAHCTNETVVLSAHKLREHLNTIAEATPSATSAVATDDSWKLQSFGRWLQYILESAEADPFGSIIAMDYGGRNELCARIDQPNQPVQQYQREGHRFVFPSAHLAPQTSSTESPSCPASSVLNATIAYHKLPVLDGGLTKNQQEAYDELKALIGADCPVHVDRFMAFVEETRAEVSGRTLDAVNASLGTTMYSYWLLPASVSKKRKWDGEAVVEDCDTGREPPCCSMPERHEYKMTEDNSDPKTLLFNVNESYRRWFETHTKSLFDCFGRGPIVQLTGSRGPVQIALSQLAYFYWLRQYDVISFIRKTLDSLVPPVTGEASTKATAAGRAARVSGTRRKSTRETRVRLVKQCNSDQSMAAALTPQEYHVRIGLPATVP